MSSSVCFISGGKLWKKCCAKYKTSRFGKISRLSDEKKLQNSSGCESKYCFNYKFWFGIVLRRDVGGEGRTLHRTEELQGKAGGPVLARHFLIS